MYWNDQNSIEHRIFYDVYEKLTRFKAELRFDSFGFCRLEEATNNQLSFAVNEAVSHVLFSRESVGSLQRLDPE